MRDGHLEASGHNWVEGQGAGPRIDKGDAEDDTMYDAMGNKIDNKKAKKLTASEARKVRNRRYLFFCVDILIELFSTRPRRTESLGGNEARTPTTRFKVIVAVLFLSTLLCTFLLYLSCLASPCVCHSGSHTIVYLDSLVRNLVHNYMLYSWIFSDDVPWLKTCKYVARMNLRPGRVKHSRVSNERL
jgi:hypothetical protein